MLVSNSFDSWQRDSFFSAAEEVQESADILESAYRRWVSAKRDGIPSKDLEDLDRELQTSLGTAKWQLEEFERAVRSSYGNHADENSMSRHKQFFVAIESQISCAEDALRKSLNEEGKEQFRWVNLDEDERDDLAMFLSGFSATPSKSTRDETTSHSLSSGTPTKSKDSGPCSSSYSTGSNILRNGLSSSKDEIVINMRQPESIMERSAWESDRIGSARRAQSVSNFGSLSIMVPGEDDQAQTLIQELEDTSKERGSRLSMFLHSRVMNHISQLMRRSNGMNSKMQFSRRMQSGPSIRLIIILIVSFFLLVPYLLK